MIIHEYNFVNYAHLINKQIFSENNAALLCNFVHDKSFQELQNIFETTDDNITFMMTDNRLWFVATEQHTYIQGVDFESFERQTEESQAISLDPESVLRGDRSIDIAWPINNFASIVKLSEMDI